MNDDDTPKNRRKSWIHLKAGPAEVEAHGITMILMVCMLALLCLIAWTLLQHMTDARASTVALREMLCVLREPPDTRKNVADWCAQQARFGMSASHGAWAARYMGK